MIHVYVSEKKHHWFRQWLVALSAPSQYLNQCWNIVECTLRTKFREILIRIHTFSFKKMHLKMSYGWRPFYLGLNVTDTSPRGRWVNCEGLFMWEVSSNMWNRCTQHLDCLLHHILSLIVYTFRENREFAFICVVQFMMSTNSRIRFGLQIVFVCLHHLIIIIVQTLSEDIELIKCLSDIIGRVCE